MSSGRVFQKTCAILVLIAGNYELYRIQNGTHPYWSPKLEAAKQQRRTALDSPKDHSKDNQAAQSESSETSLKWTNLNGVPIPTLDALMRPFRKD